jgi:hypothetical protein
MASRWLVVALVTTLGLSACKSKDEGPAASAGPDPQAQKEQSDLLARRDALLKTRQQIKDEQAKVEAQRRTLAQQGGDTSELDKKAQELATQNDKLAADESQLLDSFERTLAELNTARVGADQSAQVAAREGSMATREKQVATREAAVAAREATLADRERGQAVREKETCSGGGAGTTTIIQQVDAKGSKYSKHDVEPLLKGARDAMSRKGLLGSDLPAQAQGLEREATKAMGEGDFGGGFFAARQLAATIDAIKIDRGFVSTKIARLSARMKGASLDPGKQKQVDDLFVDATTKYGDGDFAGANRKLNQIYAVVQ